MYIIIMFISLVGHWIVFEECMEGGAPECNTRIEMQTYLYTSMLPVHKLD